MEKEKILNELNNQAEIIKTQITKLHINELTISLLDVDLLKKKTVEFYDMISKLEQLIEKSSNIDVKITPDIVTPKEEILPIETPDDEKLTTKVENVNDEIIEKLNIDNLSEIIKDEVVENTLAIKETIIDKPVIASPSTNEIEPESTSIPKLILQTPSEEEKAENPTIVEKIENRETQSVKLEQTTYDLFSENIENVVAEKFHFTEEQSIADKMQKLHISNIREAIGINEKFLFINELFNGDLGRYNKILDDINDLPTKQGVDTYLFELKIQFQWADDSEAYVKLKELLERKFV